MVKLSWIRKVITIMHYRGKHAPSVYRPESVTIDSTWQPPGQAREELEVQRLHRHLPWECEEHKGRLLGTSNPTAIEPQVLMQSYVLSDGLYLKSFWIFLKLYFIDQRPIDDLSIIPYNQRVEHKYLQGDAARCTGNEPMSTCRRAFFTFISMWIFGNN